MGGETLSIPVEPSDPGKVRHGRAMNFCQRFHQYLSALRNAPETEVGELKRFAPLVTVTYTKDPLVVTVKPRAEDANALLAESLLKCPTSP
jgi:hypothetical protein